MKNKKLELIRGLAATEVFICHVITSNSYFQFNYSLNFITNWATEAVVIFFILSGIVINMSQQKQQLDRITFFKKRLIRLYPMYLVGLILALLLLKYVLEEQITFAELIGNLFFLGTFQSYIVSVFKTNPVVWSLTFEFFFYIMFTLCISGRQNKLLLAWGLVGFLSIPFYYLHFTNLLGHIILMLSFSLVWLSGYLIYQYRNLLKRPDLLTTFFFTSILMSIARLNFIEEFYDILKYLVFSIFCIPLFIFCLNDNQHDEGSRILQTKSLKALLLLLLGVSLFYFSNALPRNKIIYWALPFLLFVFGFFKNTYKAGYLKKQVLSMGVYLGKISYAMYIIHFPIVIFINYIMPAYLFYLTIPFTMVIVILGSVLLENKFQPFVNSLFQKSKVVAL